jgi:hypothetical protein
MTSIAMTRFGWIQLFVCFVLLSGCVQSLSSKPYGTPGSAVKPVGSESYIYFNGDFEGAKRSGQYIFNFGFDELQGHPITDGEYIGQYLAARKLMPTECKNSIDLIRNGRTEHGNAWVIFKCR